MKVLIIGASGFIGRELYAEALSRGHKVLGTQFSDKMDNLIKFDLLKDRINDVLPSSFLQGKEVICAVICSAISKIEFCSKNRALTHQINVEKTIRLLQDLHGLGIKSAFLSSDAVYDGQRGYYSEEIACSPLNEYGRQKAEVERYILNHASTDLILRLSKVVGENPSESHLFSEWYQCIQSKKPIIQFDGQVFSPTYIKDVAHGILNSLEKNLNGLYNMANSEFFSRDELARQFIYALGEQINILNMSEESFSFLEKRGKKTYLDSGKFNRAITMQFTTMSQVFNLFIKKLQST